MTAVFEQSNQGNTFWLVSTYHLFLPVTKLFWAFEELVRFRDVHYGALKGSGILQNLYFGSRVL